jgi:tripartite-type tricarboxylate transporter receptor subunit TctC
MRIRIARRSAFGLGAALFTGAAKAATLDRTARLLTGFPPGGASDIVARLFAERLAGGYAPQVVVENRPGAAARLAIEAVKAAAPDGTTVLFTPESVFTIYPHIYRRTLRYEALTDFVPVSGVSSFAFAWAVATDHPARDLAEYIAWTKRQREPVPYATPAPGTVPHFAAEQMARRLGMPLTHVAYRGMAPAYPDLYAGRIGGVMTVLGDLAEQQRGGRVRVLAVTAPQRSTRLPDVPSFAELGHPELGAEEQFGVLLPAGASASLVQALHAAIVQASTRPELREALAKMEQSLLVTSPETFAARLRSERERWGPIVQATGYTVEE